MSQHIYYHYDTHHHSTNPSLNDNQSKLDEFLVKLAESQEPLENDFQKFCQIICLIYINPVIHDI